MVEECILPCGISEDKVCCDCRKYQECINRNAVWLKEDLKYENKSYSWDRDIKCS